MSHRASQGDDNTKPVMETIPMRGKDDRPRLAPLSGNMTEILKVKCQVSKAA